MNQKKETGDLWGRNILGKPNKTEMILYGKRKREK